MLNFRKLLQINLLFTGKEQLIKILSLLNKETDFLDHRINQMSGLFFESSESILRYRKRQASKLDKIVDDIDRMLEEAKLDQRKIIELIEERDQIVSNSAYYSSEVFTKADFLEKINVCIDINLEEINYIRGLLFDCAFENCSIGLSEVQKEICKIGIEHGYIMEDGKTVKNKAGFISELVRCGILLDSREYGVFDTYVSQYTNGKASISDLQKQILEKFSWGEIDGLFRDKKNLCPITREQWRHSFTNRSTYADRDLESLIEVYISRKNNC